MLKSGSYSSLDFNFQRSQRSISCISRHFGMCEIESERERDRFYLEKFSKRNFRGLNIVVSMFVD